MYRINDTVLLLGCCKELGEEINYRKKVDVMWVGKALRSYLQDEPDYMDKFDHTNKLQLIEIHNLYRMDKRYPEYIEWLKESVPKEVTKVMQAEFCNKKTFGDNIIVYPIQQLLSKYEYKAYMSTFAYMVSYAMHLGYKKIEVYGASMILNDDYIQKNNFEAWLTYAMGKGITVQVTEESDLLKCPKMYGYEVDNTLGVYMQQAIEARKEHLIQGLNSISEGLNMMSSISDNLKTDLFTLYRSQKMFMREIYNRHGLDPIVSGKSDFETDDTND